MENNKLPWEIVERPIYSNYNEIEGYKAIFRDDTETVLNVAKSTYTPVTNERFFQVVNFLSQYTKFPLKDFGEVDGGKKVLAFLQVTEPLKILGYDFKDYLMIGNSHDGSTGFFIGNSNMMVRCSNRFTKHFRNIEIRHTTNLQEKIENLLTYFQNHYMNERAEMKNTFEKWSGVDIDEEVKTMLVERLVNLKHEERADNSIISVRKKNLMKMINLSIVEETNALGNNLFGLFNGVTHYTTHTRKNRQQIFCNALGGANEINQTAYKFCDAFSN
ncbi:uncharacterized protein DUF932 [Arcicella aurantiaca]|uniref:Uncharacterized protein DUF932 n=1 Tax=Arcicella aurantiaca TaxID=591202 RepID=A0A316E9V9_9BACT|nr:DUF932 domain-containing protein [Arcicella aurantiaca]PWK27177.1 uncharacterized protein DUF932 [Arcicella aurantiaca]